MSCFIAGEAEANLHSLYMVIKQVSNKALVSLLIVTRTMSVFDRAQQFQGFVLLYMYMSS